MPTTSPTRVGGKGKDKGGGGDAMATSDIVVSVDFVSHSLGKSTATSNLKKNSSENSFCLHGLFL